MSKILVALLLSIVTFLLIDFLWLTVIAKNFYRTHLGDLLAQEPRLWAAALFYALFMIGLMVFVVAPNLDGGNAVRALLLGALYGLVTYATYDLTNQATLKNWPVLVTVVDLCWGTGLTSAVSYFVVVLTDYLTSRFSI